MKRKQTRSKRKLLLSFLLPLFLSSSVAVGYGFWHDYVHLKTSLITAQKPSIAMDSSLINTPNGIVKLVVNESTWVIESIEPHLVQVQINIISNGTTPINEIIATDALPNDWRWHEQEVQVQLIQADETVMEIIAAYFEAIYDPSTYTLTVTIHDIKAAISKYLEQNEKIRIIFYMEYALIGSTLPQEFAYDLPEYTNLAAATAWIGGWSSDLTTASTTFTIQMSRVGEA